MREDDFSRAQAWSPELDQRLHFSIDNRAPGKYLALAAEDDDPDLWDNPDVMRLLLPEASAIELHENEHATLRLNLITKEVTDRIRQQIGLN